MLTHLVQGPCNGRNSHSSVAHHGSLCLSPQRRTAPSETLASRRVRPQAVRACTGVRHNLVHMESTVTLRSLVHLHGGERQGDRVGVDCMGQVPLASGGV